jgi:anti-sigma factor RsiW
MNHEHFREQMALALYDELGPDESMALDQHLEHCDECRRFQSELARGMGRVRSMAEARVEAELPADWIQRLAEATCDEVPRRARVSPWVAAVTSFAAGILVAALVAHRVESPSPGLPSPESTRPTITADEANYARYLRATPPPPATGGGQLARLSSYVKR